MSSGCRRHSCGSCGQPSQVGRFFNKKIRPCEAESASGVEVEDDGGRAALLFTDLHPRAVHHELGSPTRRGVEEGHDCEPPRVRRVTLDRGEIPEQGEGGLLPVLEVQRVPQVLELVHDHVPLLRRLEEEDGENDGDGEENESQADERPAKKNKWIHDSLGVQWFTSHARD